MQLRQSYWMHAKWGSREESPPAIADHFLRTIDGLRALSPLLEHWSWGDSPELRETRAESGAYPLDVIRPRMAEAVARNMGTAGEPEPDPDYGYDLMSQTEGTPPDGRVDLGGSAGARPGRPGLGVTPFTNRIHLDADWSGYPGAQLRTVGFGGEGIGAQESRCFFLQSFQIGFKPLRI